MRSLSDALRVPGSARSPRSSGARPRLGDIRPDADPAAAGRGYERGRRGRGLGARRRAFRRHWDDLRAARAAPAAAARQGLLLDRGDCERRARPAPMPCCCCCATSTTSCAALLGAARGAGPRRARRGARRRRARARGRPRRARDRRQRPRSLDVRDRPARRSWSSSRAIPRRPDRDRRERHRRRAPRARRPSSRGQTRSSSARRSCRHPTRRQAARAPRGRWSRCAG